MPDESIALESLVQWAPFPLPPNWPGVLERAYGEGRRAYHTLAHVAEVAKHFDFARSRSVVHDPSSVFVAILFHDAVYDAKSTDNEARSAVLARTSIEGAQLPVSADRVAMLILATASHGSIDPREDSDLALFLDCDMAILGADETAYDAYERGVAYEYAEAYPADLFRVGRAQFLVKLVERPRLFVTDLFHETYDEKARKNLRRAIATLTTD
jgi:predicted metal-dependent HD superfamily phosphohydrolase